MRAGLLTSVIACMLTTPLLALLWYFVSSLVSAVVVFVWMSVRRDLCFVGLVEQTRNMKLQNTCRG